MDGGIVNIPAFLIVVLMSIFLIRGTEGSSIFNGIVVFLKVSVIAIFVVLGWKYINADNYTPYIPANTGTLGEYGLSGVLRGAAIVFFAFLGFDAVSTAAQETKIRNGICRSVSWYHSWYVPYFICCLPT